MLHIYLLFISFGLSFNSSEIKTEIYLKKLLILIGTRDGWSSFVQDCDGNY